VIIPGATSLGRGFDIFGRVSNQDSLLTPLIEMRSTDRSETVDGVEFEIPLYANVDRNAHSEGKTQFFSTRRKFEEHFAAEANVTATYGLFTAEFSAAYSSDRKVEESNNFALYDVMDTRYTLSLSDASINHIKEEIRPAFETLPNEFERENCEVFWMFFSKYGTHYTTQVELGGRLFYYASIAKSYTSDAKTASAKMTAEYTGVFGGKVEASAAWSQADEKWMENRQVSLKVTGGSSNVLSSLVPTKGVNKGEIFQEWLQSIRSTPSVMRYKLRPISELAPPEKEQALRDAFGSFSGAKISAHAESKPAWDGVSNIFVMGRPLVPQEPTRNMPSIQVAVLDCLTLQPLQDKRWYADVHPYTRTKSPFNIDRYNDNYNAIYESLKQYKASSHIVLFATSNITSWATPTSNLALFLQSCGAGKQLENWYALTRATADFSGINYVLIGSIGSGPNQGFEHCEMNRGTESNPHYADAITISALLLPVRANKSTQFRPTSGGLEQLSFLRL
jgi:MAC/Perforin domain